MVVAVGGRLMQPTGGPKRSRPTWRDDQREAELRREIEAAVPDNDDILAALDAWRRAHPRETPLPRARPGERLNTLPDGEFD